jgi:hypothetical protein
MVHPKMTKMTSALVAVLVVASAQAQTAPPPLDARYRFTVGGAPVAGGTLWLYNEESVGPDRVELGAVKDGVSTIHLDASMIESIDAHDDKNVYWVALHVEGIAWFKTPSFRDPFREIAHAIGELGRTSHASGGPETIVDLKPPVTHSIQLLDVSGRPLAGIKLRIHTYLGEKGRCRIRNEFEDSDPRDGAKDDNHHLVSDNDGRVQFIAPFARLVLHVEHHTRERNGAGRDVLVQAHDVDVPPALNQTVRLQMRAPARSFAVRVLTPAGAPVAGVWLVKDEAACGGSDSPQGTTDANGDVETRFAPEHAASMWLQAATPDGFYYAASGDRRRVLSEAELAQLFKTGALTVTWQPLK